MNYILELKDFAAIESDERGCEGCAFKEMPLYGRGGTPTNCGKVACFSEDFPEGHPLHTAVKPIIWIRKEAAQC